MNKPFKISDIKDLLYKFSNEDLTYNELTEELNEIANEWHNERIKVIADEFEDFINCKWDKEQNTEHFNKLLDLLHL